MSSAIEVRGVSKHFRLYHEKYTSLKERAIHFGRIPYNDFWALTDIDMDIEEGTTVGLLGHNGSGKSTLLKCIVGILQPSKGEIRSRGRMAALLELGAGFHPDLTGRENIFLNASILGISRKEIVSKLDDIVSFAELEPFIDNQVKYYSSGMYVRLGFAVAVNLDPDILIVDEVLAVGDEAFQRKCMDRVKQFQRDGKTIVFVTHAADSVRAICEKVAVLDRGRMIWWGEPGEAVRTFRENLLHLGPSEAAPEPVAEADDADDAGEQDGSAPVVVVESGPLKQQPHQEGLRITGCTFDQLAGDRTYIKSGEALTIRVGYEATKVMEDVVAGIAVYDIEGRLMFGANNEWFPMDFPTLYGRGEIVFQIDSLPLLDGTFLVTIGLTNPGGGIVYDWHEQMYHFGVMTTYLTGGVLHVPVQISVHPAESAEALAHEQRTTATG